MMLRNKIARRLQQAMEENPSLSTQAKLEKKSGIGQATIGRILRKETDTRIDTLHALAVALRKPLSYFIDDESLGDNLSGPGFLRDTRKVPVISSVQAGSWSEAIDIYDCGVSDEWLDAPVSAGEYAFWLRVDGDSMTAPAGQSVPEGSLILVDPSVAPENGSLVVAKLTNRNDVTFKRLVIDGGLTYLKPLNPAYPMIQVDSDCHIVGVVTEAKQQF